MLIGDSSGSSLVSLSSSSACRWQNLLQQLLHQEAYVMIIKLNFLSLTSARAVVFLDAFFLLTKMAQSPSLDRRMSVLSYSRGRSSFYLCLTQTPIPLELSPPLLRLTGVQPFKSWLRQALAQMVPLSRQICKLCLLPLCCISHSDPTSSLGLYAVVSTEASCSVMPLYAA